MKIEEIEQPDGLDVRAYCPNCGTPVEYQQATLLSGEPAFRMQCGECGQFGIGDKIDGAWIDAGGRFDA